MENKDLHNFTFVSTFLTDIISLPYEQRCQISDAICYWGVYRKLPPEIENNALAIALLKNAQRMIEGQDKFKEQQKENGGNHKSRAIITDEEIIGAYFRLKEKMGREPTEKEVIKESGKDVKRIAARPIWDKKLVYWNEYVSKGCITIHDTVYNYTKNDTTIQYNTQNYTNEDAFVPTPTKNDSESIKPKPLFDF